MTNLSWVFMATRHSFWRKVIGIISVASAVCLLTWTAGTALTSLHQLEPQISKTTSQYSCWVAPKSEQTLESYRRGGGIQRDVVKGAEPLVLSPTVVKAVKESPLFSDVEILHTERVRVQYREKGQVRFGPMPVAFMNHEVLSHRHRDESVLEGRWPSENSETPEVVFDSALFRAKPELNEIVGLLTDTDRIDVKIVGYVTRGSIVPGIPTVFPNKIVRDRLIAENDDKPNFLLCIGKLENASEDLLAELKSIGLGNERLEINDRAKIVASSRNSTWLNLAKTMPLKVGIALAFMLCMIFTNIYTGIQQRRQVFARLRGIGMSKTQLAISIVYDAVKMGFVGAVLGIAGGYFMLQMLVKSEPDSFPLGVYFPISWMFVLGGVTLLITLLALVWPCVKVFRMRPKDFNEAKCTSVVHHVSWKTVIPGFVLMLPAIVLAIPWQITPDTRCWLIGWVAVPLLIIGLLLCSSLWLKIIDVVALPVVSKIVGLDIRLLRHQITRDIGRTIGVMVTIAVGLGLFVAIEVWGASMLKPFQLNPELPDISLYSLPYGFDAKTIEEIGKTEGIQQDSYMPVMTDQLLLTDELTKRLKKNVRVRLRQNNLLVVGVDPDKCFGENALMPFELHDKMLQDASRELQEPGTCIIVESFARHAGLSVGDSFTLRVPDDLNVSEETPFDPSKTISEHEESLKVIGVMDVNWHMWTSRNGIRGRNGKADKTVGMVFVNYQTARKMISPPDKWYFAWFNLTPEYRAMGHNAAVQKLEASLNSRFSARPGMEIIARHRDQIVEGTIIRARGMIGSFSSVPFWSLIIFSLSILNLLIAIVYERKRELGMLRAVGMTRGQFVRQLTGEIILVWGAAVVLSIVSGIASAWTFTGWTRAVTSFSTVSIEIDVPWVRVLSSIALSLTACCLMAAGPIAWITRQKPVTMLKAD